MKDTDVFINENNLEYKLFLRCTDRFIENILEHLNVTLLTVSELEMVLYEKPTFGIFYDVYIDNKFAGWIDSIESVMVFGSGEDNDHMKLWCESISAYDFISSYDNISHNTQDGVFVLERLNHKFPTEILTSGLSLNISTSYNKILLNAGTEEDALQIRLLL